MAMRGQVIDPQNAEQSLKFNMEEQATQDANNINDSGFDQQIGSQTMRYDRACFFEKIFRFEQEWGKWSGRIANDEELSEYID